MSEQPIDPSTTAIGWVGTGVMGNSMCGHLISAGYRAAVFNRTPQRADALVARGAKWCPSPKSVSETADVVFAIVGFPSDVREVFLGSKGILAGARPGTIVVDMTTSEPALAGEIYRAAAARGVQAIDAPVSGGDIGAREARLSIMVGGDPVAAERVRPLFAHLGKTIIYQGPAGAGQHTKMVNQILVAASMIGVCEALLYAFRAGLDVNRVLESVSVGAAGSWSLTNLAPRIVKGNFDPGFFVEHFIKDMGIALAESRRMGIALPGLALVHQLYVALEAQGHGRKGTQSLILALGRLANVELSDGFVR